MNQTSNLPRFEKLKSYRINEIFYSIQGEGARAGEASLFIRFSGCNLKCRKEAEGFDCDTEFESGEAWTIENILNDLKKKSKDCRWVILTGGEPSLQMDDELIHSLKDNGFKIAIETNGTRLISKEIDWVCVSPKTAEHSIRQLQANEVKYVRAAGMGIPKTKIKAEHYWISPAFEGDYLPEQNLQCCIELVRKYPQWKLSLQQHKFWNIR